MLLAMANLIVYEYGQGVIVGALDDGARTGATVDGNAQTCEQHARAALKDLLNGAVGKNVTVTCEQRGNLMVAIADAKLTSFAPAFVPDWSFHAEATAVKERSP
jgi:hypothetical protein